MGGCALSEEIRRLETLGGWEVEARAVVGGFVRTGTAEVTTLVSLVDGVLAALERSREAGEAPACGAIAEGLGGVGLQCDRLAGHAGNHCGSGDHGTTVWRR